MIKETRAKAKNKQDDNYGRSHLDLRVQITLRAVGCQFGPACRKVVGEDG